jgi:hypothetical protein
VAVRRQRVKWALRLLSLGFRGPGSELNHSPLSGIEGKNQWSYTSAPPVRVRDVER